MYFKLCLFMMRTALLGVVMFNYLNGFNYTIFFGVYIKLVIQKTQLSATLDLFTQFTPSIAYGQYYTAQFSTGSSKARSLCYLHESRADLRCSCQPQLYLTC